MSITAIVAGQEGAGKGLKPRWDSVPRWKRRLLYGAAAMGLLGLGRDAYLAMGSGPDPEPVARPRPAEEVVAGGGSPGASALPRALAAAAGDGEASGRERFSWGGAPGRLGLSFALAFLAALAIRWFIKVVLTVAGAAAAGAALLIHFGVIDPSRFADLSVWAESLGPWLGERTDSLTALIQGHLPSGAAGGAGLFLGLRK